MLALKISVLFLIFQCEVFTAQKLVSKFPDYTKHPCKRTCQPFSLPMVCNYDFTIEFMFTMEPNCIDCLQGNISSCYNPECIVANGDNRLVNVYNRQMPGPPIEVCEGDQVVVLLDNHLLDGSTTIHWHGMHQVDTQYMDGVPMVTQCPINPYSKFQYSFIARQPGTHFYHSHSAIQRTNGAFGHLIVRQTNNRNKHLASYDFDLSEHVISVTDWFYKYSLITMFGIFRNRVFDFRQISTLVINGFGPNDEIAGVPPSRFSVTSGKRYRFRLIHAGATVCPIELRINGHKLIVIATDGEDIAPIITDSIVITNGERYDFVLNANQPPDSYLMVFSGTEICNRTSYAILDYANTTPKKLTLANDRPTPNKLIVNCVNTPATNTSCINYDRMVTLTPMDNILKGPPDFQYCVGFDVLQYARPMERGFNDSGLTSPHLNNISMVFPSSPLLQYDFNSRFCNKDNMNVCNRSEPVCECAHVVTIPAFIFVVELIFVDIGSWVDLVHPMHLHGYSFRIVAQGKLGNSTSVEEVRRQDALGNIRRNFNNPPLKDTVPVPDGGYIIVRFTPNNPGYWLFHCHVDFHVEEGMAMVFRTGFFRTGTLLPFIFPRCGDYLDSPFF